jgi:succinyl-diaminopimelate desuccinylase
MLDVVHLTQQFIRCPSVTPADNGALGVAQAHLEQLGFICHRLSFEGVENLYAKKGNSQPNFCFLGHTDVVPAPKSETWAFPPFEGCVDNGILYGRGAVDMKGAIAAFIAALSQLSAFSGSLSLLLTGDEEGPALNGTKKMLEWLAKQGEKIDFCLVGEPTSTHEIGDTLKIGRRGSLSGILTILGVGGHVAYPENFENPILRLIKTLKKLYEIKFDEGSPYFPPTHLEVVSIEGGSQVFNVVPSEIQARFNIRFNDCHSSTNLMKIIREICLETAGLHTLEFFGSGEAFLTSSLEFAHKIREIVQSITLAPVCFSTTGGTSDARFIHSLCPTIELGLKNATAHKTDEHVPIEDLHKLTNLYHAILDSF